jgi:hypothetical protein
MIHDQRLVSTWLSDWKKNPNNQKVGGGGDGVRNLQDITESIVIPVCFHVIRPIEDPTDGSEDLFLDAASLQLQLDALNVAFSSQSCCHVNEATEAWCTGQECSIDTGIRFAMLVLDANGDPSPTTTTTTTTTTMTEYQVSSSTSDANVCTTRSINETWYTSAQASAKEGRMKRALRQGDARVLNVYFNEPRTGGAGSEPLLGHATLPHYYVTNRYSDGVVLSDTTIVGGSNVEFNEGVRSSVVFFRTKKQRKWKYRRVNHS